MPEKEWENILDECKEIAEHNYQIITKVLFEENIPGNIKLPSINNLLWIKDLTNHQLLIY
mgnify:CR=1 FL=1